jgi:DNA topoisomerase III
LKRLFKRKYIERRRKTLFATETGVKLIDTISNDLLKSAELTGDWEKKLRLMEKGEYDSEVFQERTH